MALYVRSKAAYAPVRMLAARNIFTASGVLDLHGLVGAPLLLWRGQ